MTQTRSRGIAIFAWAFIAVNAFGLLNIRGYYITYSFLPRSALIAVLLYAIAFFACGIIAAVNVLRLKEWARRLMLVMALLGIVDNIIFVPLTHRSIQNVSADQKLIETLNEQYDKLPQDYRRKLAMSKEAYVDSMLKTAVFVAHLITGIIEVGFTIIFGFLMFWYFLRRKVREEFH